MKWAATWALCLACGVLAGCSGGGGQDTATATGDNSTSTATGTFQGSVVLGSPTADAVSANVYAANLTGSVTIAYGRSAGHYE